MSPKTIRPLWVLMLVLVSVLASPLRAQDTTERDPLALARQLLGYTGAPAIPPPFPVYKPGDAAQFWVSKSGGQSPTEIRATLAAAAPGVYLWVEDGLVYDADALNNFAQTLDFNIALLQIADNQGGIRVVPQTRDDLRLLRMLRLPDVDNDPHLYILFAANLSGNRPVIYNPINSIPVEYAPGGSSNQHEMLIVNTSAFPGTPFHDGVYSSVLLRQFMITLATINNPDQSPWLRDALVNYMLLEVQERDLQTGDIQPFLAEPNTPLTRIAGTGSGGQEYGAGQLFVRYLRQRFGQGLFIQMFSEPGQGVDALSNALARNSLTDLVTGAPLTADDVFADFAIANVLNTAIGDGRYVHELGAAQGQFAAATLLRDQFNFQLDDLGVTQLGTAYLGLTTSQPVDFNLTFSGATSASLLPIPGEANNHFYWSGASINEQRTMTRAFDLTGVSNAVLTFDAWHVLNDGWNYAYVQVSTDGGATWDILPASSTNRNNPYGLAYGPGFTGISNPEGTRPFPYLGVGLDVDGITITEVADDGPVKDTEIVPGDVIAGFESTPWPGRPNVIGYLSNFEPGDTVTLYIQRGNEFLDVPVTLGIHPTRVFIPDPIWVEQRADLSAYAGQSILLRFSTITAADYLDRGFAVDNIAIEALGYSDDAESGVQGWTLNGWQQLSNQVSQRFLVQYALLDTEDLNNSRVERLLDPRSNTTNGTWDFSLAPGQLLMLAISGANDDTDAVARFGLLVQSDNAPATPAPSGSGA